MFIKNPSEKQPVPDGTNIIAIGYDLTLAFRKAEEIDWEMTYAYHIGIWDFVQAGPY